MKLRVLPGSWLVARLPPDAEVPALAGPFLSVTRTAEELSIVAPEGPGFEGDTAERGFALLRAEGPIPFSQVGVLASLVGPLARAGISIFSVSTFDTDYLLVRESALGRALEALREAGHEIGENARPPARLRGSP